MSKTKRNNPVFEQDGAIGIARFSEPEKKNALSERVLDRLEAFLVAGIHELDRLIFTGVEDVFAAGANIREVNQLDTDSALEFSRKGQRVFEMIREADCLTIAAINGHCMGGALDLALSCDVRIAVSEAKLAHPGAMLGIITGWGGTQILPAKIGRKKALEMMLTAKRVSASEALAIGLIDGVSDDPLSEAIDYVF